jgi:hypothetical protein
VCVVLVLSLVAAFVDNLVCAEKYSLRVELLGEKIEPKSCAIMAGDSCNRTVQIIRAQVQKQSLKRSNSRT